MDGWTQFNVATIEAAMPTDLDVLYRAWVNEYPSKATRLVCLVAETLARFRGVVELDPAVELDVAEDTIPLLGFQYAVKLTLFNLGMEMGVQMSPEASKLMTEIDVWLRMVASGTVKAVPAVSRGMPRYSCVRREA